MLDTTQIIQEQFLHLKILNKTTSARFPLSCNVIYLQVLRIMMWTSLGGGNILSTTEISKVIYKSHVVVV